MAAHKTGGEIDAFCNKCKLTLAHTILAMVGDKVVRVQCNTCGSQHMYRGASPSGSASKPRATAARASSGSSGAAVSKITLTFESLLAEKHKGTAKKYSPKETYAKDDVIDHPNFGFGVVLDVRGDKVNVLFKMAEKTLVHGRGGAPAARPTFAPPVRGQHRGPADKPMSEEEAAAAAESGPSAPDDGAGDLDGGEEGEGAAP